MVNPQTFEIVMCTVNTTPSLKHGEYLLDKVNGIMYVGSDIDNGEIVIPMKYVTFDANGIFSRARILPGNVALITYNMKYGCSGQFTRARTIVGNTGDIRLGNRLSIESEGEYDTP